NLAIKAATHQAFDRSQRGGRGDIWIQGDGRGGQAKLLAVDQHVGQAQRFLKSVEITRIRVDDVHRQIDSDQFAHVCLLRLMYSASRDSHSSGQIGKTSGRELLF